MIGQGSFGNVYIANINNSPQFVIKEAVLSKKELDKLHLNKSLNFITHEHYPNEYGISMLVNNSLYNDECPNFLLTYNIALCQSCRSTENICSTVFVEKACGDLTILSQTLNRELVLAAIQQLMAALFWLHSKFGIYHNDIKKENVLFIKGLNQGYTRYIVNDVEYNVKNVGYIFCLNDFGLSKVYKPHFSTMDFYGTRNAQVTSDGTLIPITIKDNTTIVTWTDETTSTNNAFTSSSKDVINLNDTISFPPFEFYYDIQDLLKTFVGGSSPTQRYPHEELIEFPEIKKYTLDNFVYDKMHSAKYIRADLMLSNLYTDTTPIRVENTWVI
jgi:serine/threonine protein kinase